MYQHSGIQLFIFHSMTLVEPPFLNITFTLENNPPTHLCIKYHHCFMTSSEEILFRPEGPTVYGGK